MSGIGVTLAPVAPTPYVTLAAEVAAPVLSILPLAQAPVVTLQPAAGAPVVQLAEANGGAQITLQSLAQGPVVATLFQQAGNALNPATQSIQVALQAFMRGPVGPQGVFPTLTVAVQTLPFGETAVVTQTVTDDALELDFGLPQTADLQVTAHGDPTIAQPSVETTSTSSGPSVDIAIPTYAPFHVDEFVAAQDGATTRNYGAAPSPKATLFINGLRQAGSAFTVSGMSATFPDTLEIKTGDLITFNH